MAIEVQLSMRDFHDFIREYDLIIPLSDATFTWSIFKLI